MFKDKTVILGITGSIAAYKGAYLTSLLKKSGADVHVMMTKNAAEFVTALTFEGLSRTPVITDMFARDDRWDIAHITLAQKAAVMIIAPATANIIAKLAAGIADDMISSTVLAATCPVIIAPAMNTFMYKNAATAHNIAVLAERGFHVMDTENGDLACGYTGSGRMKEPEEIFEYAKTVLDAGK